MADVATMVRQFTVTVPAGTLSSAPYTADISLEGFEIESIDLEVPPGPTGLMSFYLARSGQQVIPYETGEWITWDDRFKSWHLTDQPTGSGWQVVAYNTGKYDHDIVVRFHVSPLSVDASVTPTTLTFATSGASASAGVLL